ncbi:MAG: NAD-dependent epimerase/dehydratase family protein, partial [Armatimonadia bacterium]
RYFNVFGPRQDPKSQYAAVIPIFCTRILAGERPVIYGDGEQSRDFTYVDNVVQANVKAALATDGAGQAFNIACGDSMSLNQLVRKLNDLIGTNIEPIYEAARVGDVKHSLADISAARAAFGYEPAVQMDEGLEQTVRSFLPS